MRMGRSAVLCLFFARETEFEVGIAGVDCMMAECSRQADGA